jgi:hypothetical protein
VVQGLPARTRQADQVALLAESGQRAAKPAGGLVGGHQFLGDFGHAIDSSAATREYSRAARRCQEFLENIFCPPAPGAPAPGRRQGVAGLRVPGTWRPPRAGAATLQARETLPTLPKHA